jgi:hypothetical protein
VIAEDRERGPYRAGRSDLSDTVSNHPRRIVASMMRVPPNPMQTDWRSFLILKKIRGVAIMGGCVTCGRKFFTPSTLFQDSSRAEDYLRRKFGEHDCQLGK